MSIFGLARPDDNRCGTAKNTFQGDMMRSFEKKLPTDVSALPAMLPDSMLPLVLQAQSP